MGCFLCRHGVDKNIWKFTTPARMHVPIESSSDTNNTTDTSNSFFISDVTDVKSVGK